MEEFLMGITLFFTLFLTIRAVRLYRSYKGSFYSVLFPSFLEYFFKYEVQKDCSKSSFLKSAIGTQRMLFSIVKNEKGAVTHRFVSIVYNKGVAMISFLSPRGQVRANQNEKYWTVKSEGSQPEYRIVSPELALNEYRRRFEQLIPDSEIRMYIAVGDALDLSGIKSDLPVLHYKDIISALKSADAPYISEEMIVEEFAKLSRK
ncbi:MAG: hypothetical protein WBL80_04625 [Erysipelotrichaceae bacterium]